MRDFTHQIVYSAIFFLGGGSVLSLTGKTPPRTLTQNTPKDAVSRMYVPFGVAIPKFNIHIHTHFPQKTVILGPDFDGTEKFSPESSFNIGGP